MIDSALINWKNGVIDVEFEFDRGCLGSVDRYGQKNEPDTSDELTIIDILFKGNSVMALFDEDDLAGVQDKIWAYLCL